MNFKTEFFLPTLLLLAGNGYAMDWFINPDISASERYTDNLRLVTYAHKDDLISAVAPNLAFGYLADDNELKAAVSLNQLLYHSESDLNYLEQVFSLNHLYKGEGWNTNVTAKYADQSSISNQLDINGSGFIAALLPTFTRSVTPTFNYQLTEKNTLQLSYNYLDAAFSKPTSLQSNIFFANYSNQSTSATFTHYYSQRLSFNLTGSYTIYDAWNDVYSITPPRFSLRTFRFLTTQQDQSYRQHSTTLSYQIGLQYSLDERTTFTANAGIRDSSSKSSNIFNFTCFADGYCPPPTVLYDYPSTTSGKIYSASLSRQFEKGEISLSANQQLNPASTGTQQQTSQLSASARYEIDERWSVGISGQYLTAQSISSLSANTGNLGSFNRNYTAVSPNLQWKWDQDMHLEFSYNHIDQHYTQTNLSALSNSVQLQFFYQPQLNRQVK